MIEYKGLDLDSLKNLAKELAMRAKVGDIYLLHGDLGAGKTTFTQAFVECLGVSPGSVNSPTFNLVHVYTAREFEVWHFDLYRLKNLEELRELGLSDAINTGVTIIEWPEIAEGIFPKSAIRIHLKLVEGSPELRDVKVINGY
ncbi:MAG: tRNA (adenosine(37)-N6)-threonylcarbamoyltransferase complex ATPase subunit type 1 TsaE [Candidatus Jidaibacter sp.]|jgi:tRNA threonylcarbamoyl adenosine modification protein YjeE|nr:tRNA (adenosine(37)-N6)-threonylcarbamoyltransferase complex ATPase subunit type 1 TsaE [Candidatus Jidaibacter sp.]